MSKLTLKQVYQIANIQPENAYEQKKKAIEAYEGLDCINVVDSAYPNEWATSIRKRLGVRNIGAWGWAYGDEYTHGIPVPCDPRALAYFDTLFSKGIIRQNSYENNRQTAFVNSVTDEA